MGDKYFFVSDTIPKTGIIYQQLYPDTNADTWDEPSNGRIIYPDGTIKYFAVPYEYDENNLPIPSKDSKVQDAFWEILLSPNVIDYDKKGDLDKVRKEKKKAFADEVKPSRLRPKKFQPGGDIEDEMYELPPYYNGTDTVPSTNTTNNKKYGHSTKKTTNDLNEEAKQKQKLGTLAKPGVMTTGYKVPISEKIFKEIQRNSKYPILKGIPIGYKHGGNIAVKIDRGNGIEGYRSVSRNDVNWVRNADGRYVPQLKEFARGGKTRKFQPGGKSAFDLFEQLSGNIKRQSNFGPEVIQGALEMIRNKNRMKTSENAVHRIPQSQINWVNQYLRNLQAPNNISQKARFLEDNGMQIGPNGLPVYTEGINNLKNK